MFNAALPPPDALPTPKALLRSTGVAIVVAAVLLVTIVLPAEYGIDPTGIGRPLGLTRMGEIKVALALEAEADAAADAAALAAEEAAAARFREAEASAAATSTGGEAAPGADLGGNLEMAELVLQPDEAGAIELTMSEGGSVRYEWWTVGGAVSWDAHGEPSDPPAGFYHGYGKGQESESDDGVLTAAFDGLHGWLWTNGTDQVVTVTLRVEGDFKDLREIR
jgi:hypothetical protein